jgi:hypothetical protein
MLKKDMEEKLKEYKEILSEIGRWSFPIQYKIDELNSSGKALFHMKSIQKVMTEKFYKDEATE